MLWSWVNPSPPFNNTHNVSYHEWAEDHNGDVSADSTRCCYRIVNSEEIPAEREKYSNYWYHEVEVAVLASCNKRADDNDC